MGAERKRERGPWRPQKSKRSCEALKSADNDGTDGHGRTRRRHRKRARRERTRKPAWTGPRAVRGMRWWQTLRRPGFDGQSAALRSFSSKRDDKGRRECSWRKRGDALERERTGCAARKGARHVCDGIDRGCRGPSDRELDETALEDACASGNAALGRERSRREAKRKPERLKADKTRRLCMFVRMSRALQRAKRNKTMLKR